MIISDKKKCLLSCIIYCFYLFINFFQAEQHKKATVITAEGDTQGASLLAKAFGESGEALVELRRLEAAEDIAYQMSKSRNVVYLPSGQGTLLQLPQQDKV